MANEIDISVRMTLNESLSTAVVKSVNEIRQGTLKVSQTTALMVGNVQVIGFAAHEALVMGDVAAAGYAYFRNLSATNFVQIGTDVAAAFVPFVKLKAGEVALLRLGTNAPYAKADTAAVNLQYVVLND